MTLHLLPSKSSRRFHVVSALACCLPCSLLAQTETVKPAIPLVEPGLEQAVKWNWKVEPAAAAAWGLPVDVPVETPEIRPAEPVPPDPPFFAAPPPPDPPTADAPVNPAPPPPPIAVAV